MDKTALQSKLDKAGQGQLLRFWDELDDTGRMKLAAQIEGTDFGVVDLSDHPSSDDTIEPIEALTLKTIEENKEIYRADGLAAIRQGRVGAVLLAGGQGTRLGHEGPKGTFNIGESKELFIFECLINNLMDVVREAGCMVPLFIMTSDINDAATRAFFKEHDYFGYDPSYVDFFIQDMAPASDYSGKVYLQEKDSIALSPNGNGGWFRSLRKAGLIDKIERSGIEWLNIFAVDNVLQRMADPVFVGATIRSGFVSGAKVIGKADPYEKVGVMCLRNGMPSIVEYYELTDEMAHQQNPDGTRAYNWGVILNYLFRVDALIKAEKLDLPLHRVEKKIPYIDENGTHFKPDKPNGYKFETLILDMVQMMDGCCVFEVDRAKEFAPVKNLTGVDSAESARAMLKAYGVEI